MGKHLSVHRHSQLAQFSVDVLNISQMDFRRVTDGDDSVREIRISCPDATGLGCDIARMLLDFGLKILSGWARVPAASCVSPLSSQGYCPQESVHISTAAAADTACICGAGDVSTDGKWCFLIIKVTFVGSPVWQLPCSCCCPLTMSRPPKLVVPPSATARALRNSRALACAWEQEQEQLTLRLVRRRRHEHPASIHEHVVLLESSRMIFR